MINYIFKRLLEAIPLIWIIITVTFFMVRLTPGDQFTTERGISEETRAALESYYGFDKPLHEQYWSYLTNLVTKADFGPSRKYEGWGVGELMADRIPVSLELGFYAILIALLIGMGAGIIASIKPNSWSDYTPMMLAMLGICLPTFVLGPLLLYAFGLKLEWFSVWGWILPQDKVLPSITLGMVYAAYFARLTRGSMLEVRAADYVRTAHAKGLAPVRVHLIHALRNALTPVVAFTGPALAGLVSGSFVIESVFQIPGLGKLFVDSAMNRDNTLIMGVTIFYATLLILFNLLMDIIMVWLNPKRRFE